KRRRAGVRSACRSSYPWCSREVSSPEISRTRCSILAIMNAAQALAISEPLKRFLALMLIELSRSTKPRPTGLRALPAVTCTGFDHMPLEGGKAGDSPCGVKVSHHERKP